MVWVCCIISLGLTYVPQDLIEDPCEFGFKVTRTYEYVDHPNDINCTTETMTIVSITGVKEEKERRHFRIKQGSRIRVVLRMSFKDVRYHLALVDKLAAGMEAINPKLPGQMGSVKPRDLTLEPLWSSWWPMHTNMRDERVEAFKDYLQSGNHGFDYIARATSRGKFVVPSCKAEEMYSPEIFGKSGTDIIIIE